MEVAAMKRGRSRRIPSFRHHKASGQGYVVLSGTHIYLGAYAKPETQQKYHQVIAEWCANGYRLPVKPEELTVTELCAAYWNHAETHYVRPSGEPTSSLDRAKVVLRALRALYGHSQACEFGPNALRALRDAWIGQRLVRSTVNDYTAVLKNVFKWAVSHEMIPPAVYHGLATVEGLTAGRSEARDTEPVKPVLEAHVQAVEPFVARQVWAIIDLQLLTAARPGELLKLRPIDLDTTGRVWTATLREHKTRYRGRERTLYFGPKAQAILKEFLADRPLDAYLFSPREAEQERRADAPTHRRPNQIPCQKKTQRVVGNHYTTASYRQAVERACKKAGIPVWTPHRLRHNAATRIRKEYGLEAAQLLLGHARVDVTQLYAEVDQNKALSIVQRIG